MAGPTDGRHRTRVWGCWIRDVAVGGRDALLYSRDWLAALARARKGEVRGGLHREVLRRVASVAKDLCNDRLGAMVWNGRDVKERARSRNAHLAEKTSF